MTSVSPVNATIEKPKMRNKGIIRAQYAANLLTLPMSVASCGILKGMREVSKLSKKDAIQLTNATKEGLKNSGLWEKGVRAYKTTEKSPKDFIKKILKNPEKSLGELLKENGKDMEVTNALMEEIKAGKMYKCISKRFGSEVAEIFAKAGAKTNSLTYKFGLNACYLPGANKIITPKKSLQTSVFHEMGHALNNNGGMILKSLQKMRPFAMAIPGAILLISLMNKRKTTDETNKNDTVVQKSADFIKRNAGKLTALSFLPVIAEEGIASLRGQGIAKKLVQNGTLTKDLLKKIKLTNLGGFSSYVLSAVIAVMTAKIAISVKDKIQAKYEAKKMAKFEAKNNK